MTKRTVDVPGATGFDAVEPFIAALYLFGVVPVKVKLAEQSAQTRVWSVVYMGFPSDRGIRRPIVLE